VYAQDHRGHGATASSEADYGVLGSDGWTELVADIGRLTDLIRTEHPDLPLILLGHSMGSFAVQQYLVDHSDRVSAAVLTGTAAIDLLAPGWTWTPLSTCPHSTPLPAGAHRLRLAQPRRQAGGCLRGGPALRLRPGRAVRQVNVPVGQPPGRPPAAGQGALRPAAVSRRGRRGPGQRRVGAVHPLVERYRRPG